MPRSRPVLEQVQSTSELKARQPDLIDQAAERQGRTRSDFMLDASCREAEDVLLSQTFFTVDSNTFAQFQMLLDNPLPATDKLRLLKAPWENEHRRAHAAGAYCG